MTPYLQFDRNQWATLRDSVPMTLSEDEIARLKGINEDLSLEEVAEIYLPLSRLLNFYISSNLRRQAVLEQFSWYQRATHSLHYQYCWQCRGGEKYNRPCIAGAIKPLAGTSSC